MRYSRFLLLFLTAWLAFGGEGFALTLCEIECAGDSHHESSTSCSTDMGAAMAGMHSAMEATSASLATCCGSSPKNNSPCLMQTHNSHEMVSAGINLEKFDHSALAPLIPIEFIAYETTEIHPKLLPTDGLISHPTLQIYLSTSSFLC